MDAQQRWMEARKDAEEGRYAEALAGYIWFFQNSLAESNRHAGPRLSYLIFDWLNLGKRYPEALQALYKIRDEAAGSLLEGKSDRHAFHDVEAINDRLGRLDLTYQLYMAIRDKQPDLAESCANLALPSMIEARDFQLAATVMGDFEKRVVQACEQVNYHVRIDNRRKYSWAPVRWADVRQCSDHLGRTLRVVEGCGHHAEAARLKALAFSLIKDPSVRRDVDDMLRNPHRRPVAHKSPKQAMRRYRRQQKDKKKMEMAELARLGHELRHAEKFA